MEIRPFASADLDAVVRVWHAAKREAYGFLAQEQGRTLEEDRAFFSSRIAPRCALWVAVERASAPRGFLALAGSYLDRLYVHPGGQRRGVGSALLRHAMALSPAGLELHTHQRNHRGRAFYAKHALRASALRREPAARERAGHRLPLAARLEEVSAIGGLATDPQGPTSEPGSSWVMLLRP